MYGLTFIDFIQAWRPPRNKAVLVVEDDVFLKPVFRRILRSIDPEIQMHWATTIKGACQKLEETNFSLVISDVIGDPLDSPPLGQPPGGDPNLPCPGTTSFAADVQPKISTCTQCHVAGTQSSPIDLTTLAQWVKMGPQAVEMMASGNMHSSRSIRAGICSMRHQ